MTGTKRMRNGQVKPLDATRPPSTEAPVTDPTLPCAQPQLPCSKSTETQKALQERVAPSPKAGPPRETSDPTQRALSKPKPHGHKHDPKRQKLPKLPPNTTITKRPLLHPSLPTPFASSTAPKILYITSSTPFVPALKRIRKLLQEIDKRSKQSLAAKSKAQSRKPLQADGRLKSGDVEKGIADEVARAKSSADREGEKVYLKATGRAIPRALGLGVAFQKEGEGCVVQVTMGSVRAIDDIQVTSRAEGEGDGGGEVEEDVPETRTRTVSSVTVSIGLR